MRIIALLCLFGCQAGGESWAEKKLGKAGARELKSEAESWLANHPMPPPTEKSAARCPSPRVVLDVYPPGTRHADTFLEYSRVSMRAKDASLIKGSTQVRCLVLAAHAGKGGRKNFKDWMDVRLLDREGPSEQLVRIEGNDDELTSFLAGLTD